MVTMSDPGGGSSLSRRLGINGKTMDRSNMQDVGVQVGVGRRKGSRTRKIVWCSVVMVIVAIVMGVLIAKTPLWVVERGMAILFPSEFKVSSAIMQDLGMEGISLFKQHDRDDDGFLSLAEFEPLGHRLLQTTDLKSYDVVIGEDDEVVTLESSFEPLLLETMSKFKDDPDYSANDKLSPLHGLKYWKEPGNKWKNFAAEHLRPFLPGDAYIMENVGQVYRLVKSLGTMESGPSSNRYEPPPYLDEREIMLHRLISMFHPRPFIYSRFGPSGTVAVVRAFNEKYVDIVFRIHAEFQLNEPPFSPFWFTPAQFTGHMIMSKDGTRVLYFNMFVPTDKRLNVDMEWMNGPNPEDMEVDIAYMPKMSLRATRTSVHAMYGGQDQREQYIPTNEDYVKSLDLLLWDKEISMKEANRLLEVEMYPFKQVTYHNLTDAHELARREMKPVHSILLWGALDDQSC